MSVARIALGGVLATLTMDAGNLLFRTSGAYQGLPTGHAAKWFAYLREGVLVHEHIETSPEIGISMPFMGLMHFIIGITLAFGCYLVLRWLRTNRPAVVAIAYGAATSVFSLFLLFPAMGYGVLGIRSPELGLFRASVITHFIYGLGLAWSFRALGLLGGDRRSSSHEADAA